jgi:hypothetical protein
VREKERGARPGLAGRPAVVRSTVVYGFLVWRAMCSKGSNAWDISRVGAFTIGSVEMPDERGVQRPCIRRLGCSGVCSDVVLERASASSSEVRVHSIPLDSVQS